MLIERLFAALGIAACVLLLIRLLIGERRRGRLDALLRRYAQAVRGLRGMRRRRSSHMDAAKVADEAIRRARERSRRAGEWDGNVYKPKSFRKPPRDKMH